MPVPKKSTTSTSEAAKRESSDHQMPEQQEFRQRMRNLAVSAMRALIEDVMLEELKQCLGAEWGEWTPERKGYRNGSYTRDLVTKTGRIEDLSVPRDREGAFHSQVFERYKRYEPEVAEALTEMFVSGTSTHKVGKVAEKLMGVAPSSSAVSRLNQTLTEQFETWRERPLLAHYRILYLDAHPFYGSAWNSNGFDHDLNGAWRGSGRQQGGIGLAGLCRRRQRWVELSFTGPAHPWSHSNRSDCH